MLFKMPKKQKLVSLLEEVAKEQNLPLFGWTTVERYQIDFPEAHLESYLPGAVSIILLGEKMLDGVVDSLLMSPPRFIRDFWANANLHSLLPVIRRPSYLLKQLVKSKISPYNSRYHFVDHLNYLTIKINKGAYELGRVLEQAGHRALPVDPCKRDYFSLKGFLSLKHAAVMAGMGQLGIHQQMMVPGIGPRVWLGGLITTAALPTTRERPAASYCAGCRKCVEVCPLAQEAGGFTFRTHTCVACSKCMASCPGGRSSE